MYFSSGGHLTLEPSIKDKWIDALKLNHGVLAREKKIPPLDFNEWITDKYIRAAYAEEGVDYEADLKKIHDPKIAHADLPMEIWHSRDGVSTYETAPDFLKAMADIQATAALVNASYVYDVETGLKLFGKTAFWVKAGDDYATFLRKGEAEAFAAANGGTLVTFDEAIADFVTEG